MDYTGKSHPVFTLSDEDMLRYEESLLYEEKIRRLESSIDSLRLSRRILMSMLEQVSAVQEREREQLLAENRRLRSRLSCQARQLWSQRVSGSAKEDAPQT